MSIPPRLRAISVLSSWFAAVGIYSKVSGENIVAEHSNGTMVHILPDTNPEVAGDPPFATIDQNAILSPDERTSTRAFMALTEALGYGALMPVYRGDGPDHPVNYRNDYELVAMRHSDFRRSPNVADAKLHEYDSVMGAQVKRFFRHNHDLCLRNGYEHEDLLSYAMIWTLSWLHRLYRVDLSEKENRSLLSYELRQRFTNFYDLLRKKDWSCTPEAAVLNVAQETDDRYIGAIKDGDPVSLLTMYDTHDREKRKRGSKKERKRIAKVLVERLEGLPHDDYMSKLCRVAGSALAAPAAKMHARKRIRAHFEECDNCSFLGVFNQLRVLTLDNGLEEAIEQARRDGRSSTQATL